MIPRPSDFGSDELSAKDETPAILAGVKPRRQLVGMIKVVERGVVIYTALIGFGDQLPGLP
jgi:hypothetical protein